MPFSLSLPSEQGLWRVLEEGRRGERQGRQEDRDGAEGIGGQEAPTAAQRKQEEVSDYWIV